jgi:NADH dehydrogenase
VEEATDIRHKILYAFEVAERAPDPDLRRAWLSFLIVGAGPTGVELAGAIGEIAGQTLRNDFRSIRPADAQITLLDGGARILPTFPEDLAKKAERSLAKLGVQTKMGAMVTGVDRDGVDLKINGATERLSTKTVIWAGGVTVAPFARELAKRAGAETDRGGRIPVGSDLTLAKFPDSYVVGDMALSLNSHGTPLAGVAQVAMQQGAYAAKAIVRKVKGQAPQKPFNYFDKGNLAVIGRAAAVADVFGVHLSGLPAWLVWVFIHLMYIVAFQSRIIVFMKWAIQDLTSSRGARLITGTAPTDFDFNREMAASETAGVKPAVEQKTDSVSAEIH